MLGWSSRFLLLVAIAAAGHFTASWCAALVGIGVLVLALIAEETQVPADADDGRSFQYGVFRSKIHIDAGAKRTLAGDAILQHEKGHEAQHAGAVKYLYDVVMFLVLCGTAGSPDFWLAVVLALIGAQIVTWVSELHADTFIRAAEDRSAMAYHLSRGKTTLTRLRVRILNNGRKKNTGRA